MPVYSFLLKINGVDAATYGFTVWDLPDHWNAPSQSYDEVAIPGQDGTTETTTEPTIAPRDFTVVGSIDGSSASDFESKLDTLKYVLYSASLTLIGGNQATRARTGRFADMTSALFALMNGGRVEIKAHCKNPIAYETSTTTVTGSAASDLPCALGTFRSRPVITITFSGSAASVTITPKTYGGATIGTPMIVTHAFVNTDVLIVDCANQTIKVNGARKDDYLTQGDFFTLDPQNGDYALAHWPTVRVSAGSPSIAYAKAWL